jgi:hypothetical protein
VVKTLYKIQEICYFARVNGIILLALLVALLVGVPLVVSLVTDGGSRAIGALVQSSKAKTAASRRCLLSTLDPLAVADSLESMILSSDCRLERSGDHIAGDSPEWGSFDIWVTSWRGGSKIDISAREPSIEDVAAAVLASVRTLDPQVRVKAVGA